MIQIINFKKEKINKTNNKDKWGEGSILLIIRKFNPKSSILSFKVIATSKDIGNLEKLKKFTNVSTG